MTNEIVDNLQFDEDAGALNYKGIRYFLIRPETLADLYALVKEALGEEGDEAFLRAGHTGVSRSLQAYDADLGLKGKDLLAHLLRTGTELGWGKMELLSLDFAGNSMVIGVKNSVFAPSSGWGEPRCHMLRGVLSAMGGAVFGAPASTREIACLGMGDASCRFVVTAK